MKLDNSNKRYSNIIAGILVIVGLSIFMAFFIGFWGNGISEQNGCRDSFEESISGNNKIESIAQTGFWQVDVEKGTMDNVQVSWDSSYDLKICTTMDDIEQWWLEIDVYGGYDPCELCDNYFHIYQEKPDGILIQGIYLIDPLSFHWEEVGTSGPCNAKVTWRLTFGDGDLSTDDVILWKDVDGDLSTDDLIPITCMIFDSNRKPFCTSHCHLDKFVTFDLSTCWQGCPCPTQRFVKILTHKDNTSGVPNSR